MYRIPSLSELININNRVWNVYNQLMKAVLTAPKIIGRLVLLQKFLLFDLFLAFLIFVLFHQKLHLQKHF